MSKYFSNTGYFLKETFIMLKLNIVSSVLSIFSTGLILFILAMVLSGWWVSSKITETIGEDGEINIYFKKDIGEDGAQKLCTKIKEISGVSESRVIDEAEAYNRMANVLGKEASILEVFEDNPFSSFIEVKINLGKIDAVLSAVKYIEEIEHVRDNREVLERLHNISEILRLLGYMVVIAVGISTVVIISHIIRQGVYNNKDQIHTLRLLGAPGAFIALPFLLEGVLLNLSGGVIAAALAAFAIKQVFALVAGPLPFIPLPPAQVIVSGMIITVMSISIFLGVVGSILGFSAKEK